MRVTNTMNDLLNERAEALIGKRLLNVATTEELAELEALSRRSPTVREALDAIERSNDGFRASSVGEELNMTAADLPEYYRPRRLAKTLERWFRSGVRLGSISALMLTALLLAGVSLLNPDLPAILIGGGIGVAAVIVLAACVISTHRRQRGIGKEIEAGGDLWAKTVEQVLRREQRYMSRAAKALMVTCLALTPPLFILSGFSTAPLDRVFAYSSFATIAIGVMIFQRRRMMNDLRRGS